MKPLHVHVAEALGWAQLHHKVHDPCPAAGRCGDILLPTEPGMERYAGRAPGNVLVGHEGCHDAVPFYHLDWAATGPLLGRLKIRLSYSSHGRAFADHPSVDSERQRPGERDILPAVCRLILALAAAGKLEPLETRTGREKEPMREGEGT